MLRKLIISIAILVILSACSTVDPTDVPTTEPTDESTQEASTGYPVVTEPQEQETAYPVETKPETPATSYPVETEIPMQELETAAAQVINALAAKDMVALAEIVHPEQGVRFSPYAFIREEHQVFMPDELAGLVGSEQVYTWGAYDGTGDPIELTFDAYFKEFVYSSDFANPEAMAVDERIGQGNSINNIGEFYPGSSFVEYHFSGFDEQYEGMDWESLRLVFLQEDGMWWLVGIVHDEWTI
jgi:hypothetical protein